MAWTVKTWAEWLNGTVEGDDSRCLTGAATLTEATSEHIGFLANPIYTAEAEKSNAGAIVIQKDVLLRVSPQTALIRVENSYQAWALILKKLSDTPFASGISPHAWVDASAEIDASATVMEGVWIGARVRIGADCILYPGARLYPHTELRERVIVHANAVVGSDGFGYTPPEGTQVGFEKIPHIGGVLLENDVEIGANTCIDRGVVGLTRIGEGTKVDNLCQIGHNVHIGKHCVLAAQVGIAGSTVIGDYCQFGGQVGIIGHITIGNRCSVGAQSGVPKSLPDGSTVFGSPAMPLSQFKRAWVKWKQSGLS